MKRLVLDGGSIVMKRAASSILCLVFLAACTTPTAPPPEPTIERWFAFGGRDHDKDIDAFLAAVEPHGITCGGFDGCSHGVRGDCRGTEREWRQAEPAIARFTADGVVQDITHNEQPSPPPRITERRFTITELSDVEARIDTIAQALDAHGVRCTFAGAPVRSEVYCAGKDQDWRQAESELARLLADGLMTERSGEAPR